MSRAKLMTAMMVVALLLAACQGNPEPPPLDGTPTSPSPSRTTSPTVAAPSLPPEAEGTSPTAAKAFVRHYVDLVNYAMATGDTGPISNLSLSSCNTCMAIISRIDDVYSSGGRLAGAGWKVRTVSPVTTPARDSHLIAVGIDISGQVAYESGGATPSQSPNTRGNLDFHLVKRPSGWRVERLDATQ